VNEEYKGRRARRRGVRDTSYKLKANHKLEERRAKRDPREVEHQASCNGNVSTKIHSRGLVLLSSSSAPPIVPMGTAT